jgi:hypothetical protein
MCIGQRRATGLVDYWRGDLLKSFGFSIRQTRAKGTPGRALGSLLLLGGRKSCVYTGYDTAMERIAA